MQASQNLSAALLAMASTAILSFVDNFVIAVTQDHGLWQFQVVRALMIVPVMLVAARMMGQRLRPVNPLRLIARSLIVSLGLLVYFAALGTLSVAQAGAGLFSAPIWVMVLSALLFGTRVTPMQVVAIIGGFCGVLLVLQPDPARLSLWSLLPLGAGVFYGLGMMLTRYWCAQESAMALSLGVFVGIGLASLILLLGGEFGPWAGQAGFLTSGWAPLTPRFLGLTALQGAGAIVAVTLIAQAYRIGTPSYVAVFEYSFLVFAALWSLLLWRQGTDALAWIGIAVIIAAGLVMALTERRGPFAAQKTD